MQTPPSPRNEAPSHRFAAKLSPAQAEAVRGRYLSGETLTRLAAELGVSVGALSRLVNHHTYRESAARIALKLSADSALALARLEGLTKLPRRHVVEAVFERGLAAFERELAEPDEPNRRAPT